MERRKDKIGDLPINADITFGGKRIWYYTGYRIAESKWDAQTQRVKRNSFNDDGDRATDINQRLVKIESAVDIAFNQLVLRCEDTTPTTLREELKQTLYEKKNTRLTVVEVYQLSEREKELAESPATAQWTKASLTKHKTMCRHLADFNHSLYFEDITDELLARFEMFLIKKKFSNSYTYKSMKYIKTLLNWATKRVIIKM